ncbi:MAG: hypothetical protein KZQ66_15165, partial [Candidatus Thiodiazotropha sp. (ex Lucinoma aequizonata)]|nr:hypothetical protein [Candidatus Thiodiazotropha sp. (ex Lucinoma aequizonata)]MCU7897154.1 hypothetical protein [Candidatus Thiodiazotropha sp. (ex Lucinoma aequizonata)]MCU7897722.1 hypothetical protein [Candidatus Thiodiazotropha sp. (ex Lucinoma aequizonata)]MCU7903167.1 hypothetical protein [Candidatus Thiodiazotropha sp. (ex Lucinoma aequizonata)]MCU7909862.1 hypothetical protein [Candidatus Thiodiazotropha sp. (ex Lucinoma aequizonata)]
NDSTASRMRSLYALHLSLSVAIPAIQPRLRSAFHSGQRLSLFRRSSNASGKGVCMVKSRFSLGKRKLI